MILLETRSRPHEGECTNEWGTFQYIHEWIQLPDGLIAHRYNLAASRDKNATVAICYDLYRPMTFTLDGNAEYTTSTHHQQFGWLGDVTTQTIPPEIDAIRRGDRRIRAVMAHYEALQIMAQERVRAVFAQDFAKE